MPDNHATELELLDVALDDATDEVVSHISTCDECQRSLESVRSELESAGTARAEKIRRHPPRRSPLPAREPVAADVWRAAWAGTAQLIQVKSVDVANDTVVAAAVVEAEAADDASTLIPEEVLGWPAVALQSVVAELPVRVLELLIAEGIEAENHINAGPIVRVSDPRAFEHAAAHERIAELSAATWIPQEATRTLTEQLQARWSKPSELSSELEIGGTEARELLTGSRAPDAAEASRLAELGIDPAGVAAPPANAVWAADRPEFRERWRQLAARVGTSESAVRWDTYTSTHFALAARATGVDTDSRNVWFGRMREILDGLG